MQVGLMPLTWSEIIWLGIWCPDTLKGLLLQSTTSELTMSEQYIYMKIASKVTALLIDAYFQMLDINLNSQDCSHYATYHAKPLELTVINLRMSQKSCHYYSQLLPH
jgi:hypothetical protein